MFFNKVKKHGFWAGFMRTWRGLWRTMVAGLLVWVPLMITVWICWFFINKFILGIERQIEPLFEWVKAQGSHSAYSSFFEHIQYIRGLGIFFVVALFFVTGLLTRYFVGVKLIALGEKILRFVPLVNRIYAAVRQIRDVFIERQGAVFQDVCLIEYPRPGMLAVAFVTSTEHGIVQEKSGRNLVAVFVPTTPNPTSGYLVYLSPDEITMLDISVEAAMKMVVSGGAFIPGSRGPSPSAGNTV